MKLSFYKKSSKNHTGGVSVIICAKDESSNLSRNLESFLEQDFPLYEVVVVDDQSIDGSRYVLKDLSKRYSHLNVVTIEENVNHRIGKKFPLTIGIKTAKYAYAFNIEELHQAAREIGFPLLIKPVMSSSGKGQSFVKDTKVF